MSSLKRIVLACAVLLFTSPTVFVHAQDKHPHILVGSKDKQFIMKKINEQDWAKKIFDKLLGSVKPYVERHTTDPDWILSRYLMNRTPGKRYTNFYSDSDGTALVGYAGDAPYPTIRVSSHKRPPVTEDGYSYKRPALDELVPYDTSMKMLLVSNAPGGKKERVNPQTFVEGINGQINELALNAAIIHWLTGQEEYARFAADILNQWARGAFYQNPVNGPCRTGFLSIQTLGDGHYEPMPLIYDFLYEFLREKKYETSWYEPVFEKIASTMTFRGFWNNNWFAAQTPAMVFAALSLENKSRREYYLDFYMNRDTINGSCGHLALPSVITKWLTHDGHWKEPGGYHNFPVSSLLLSALALENNGYNVFGKFPALFQSSYVLLKYSFPNFLAPSIGDTGPVSQNPECLELGLLMAKKYNSSQFPQLMAAMDILIKQKGYKRESSEWLGLLSYLPEIPSSSQITYTWPRSGELDFAKCYLQRNGTDKEKGLMYLVQGASYNHNHANGMSLELYGAGRVMGIDPGKGITYEAPMHVNYYAQWAAHNTVVSGGASAAVPHFKGGGGTKRIGQIDLATMEPKADKIAVSPFYSFTDTRYTDISTSTRQQRTLGIVRTSDSSGYYIDIYRSGNPKSNEYVYHNIGNSIQFLDEKREPITQRSSAFPISKKPFDPPGFRLIEDVKSTGTTDGGVVALFSLHEGGDDKYMQVLFAGEKNRDFYSGKAPRSGTADLPYRDLPTPTIICRQQGEAWRRPFIAIYEPFNGKGNFKVERIENLDKSNPGEFTALKVISKDHHEQIILQSVSPDQLHKNSTWQFKGSFAVVHLRDTRIHYLYLGSGNLISYDQYSIQSRTPGGAAGLAIYGNRLQVSCNQETLISIKSSKANTATLTVAGAVTKLIVTKAASGISFSVPVVSNGTIEIK